MDQGLGYEVVPWKSLTYVLSIDCISHIFTKHRHEHKGGATRQARPAIGNDADSEQRSPGLQFVIEIKRCVIIKVINSKDVGVALEEVVVIGFHHDANDEWDLDL